MRKQQKISYHFEKLSVYENIQFLVFSKMEMASYPGGSVLRTKETEMMQGQFIFLI